MARQPKPVDVLTVEPFFLGINKTAAFLDISPKTIRNHLSTKTFPVRHRKLGGKVVFMLEDLRNYARSLFEDD